MLKIFSKSHGEGYFITIAVVLEIIKNFSPDLQSHWLAEIENFFATYKMLEGKASSVQGWLGAKEAKKVLRKYWCKS